LLITIVSFLVVFTLVALTHELGHLIWAKRAGIRVFEFGFGFGPRIFAKEHNNTTYSINLIPILAFVRIAGEGESPEDLACPRDENYNSKSPSQKFKAIAAGPLLNIVLAFFILLFLFAFSGTPVGLSSEVDSVSKGSPAEKAGLLAGDKIIAINKVKYPDIEKAITFIHQHPGTPLSILIDRGGKQLTFRATPKYNASMKVGLLGFSPKPIFKKGDIFLTVYKAGEQTFLMVARTIQVVWLLITGGVSIRDLAGPIGIAQITGKYAQSGLVSLLYFTAFISVNLGVLNLLPLPALDGGHIAFIFIEAITRREIDPALKNKINAVGMAFLLALMFFVSIGDILRLFGR